MSDYTPKPGTFSLWKNDYKEKETQPDYKGDGAGIDGEPLEIAGWIKEARNGKKFISLKIQEPRDKSGDPTSGLAPKKVPTHSTDFLDDEIPNFDSKIPF